MILFKYSRVRRGQVHRGKKVEIRNSFYFVSYCGTTYSGREVIEMGTFADVKIRRLCGNCFSVRNYTVLAYADTRVVK